MEYEKWEYQMYCMYTDLKNDGDDLNDEQIKEFKSWLEERIEEGYMVGVYE